MRRYSLSLSCARATACCKSRAKIHTGPEIAAAASAEHPSWRVAAAAGFAAAAASLVSHQRVCACTAARPRRRLHTAAAAAAAAVASFAQHCSVLSPLPSLTYSSRCSVSLAPPPPMRYVLRTPLGFTAPSCRRVRSLSFTRRGTARSPSILDSRRHHHRTARV